MDDSSLITARQAAVVAGVSRSKINRDADAGTLRTAQKFPGRTGPRLFDPADVEAAYADEAAS